MLIFDEPEFVEAWEVPYVVQGILKSYSTCVYLFLSDVHRTTTLTPDLFHTIGEHGIDALLPTYDEGSGFAVDVPFPTAYHHKPQFQDGENQPDVFSTNVEGSGFVGSYEHDVVTTGKIHQPSIYTTRSTIS